MNQETMDAAENPRSFNPYLDHFLVGLAIGFTVYGLFVYGVILSLPGGPRKVTPAAWELKGALQNIGLLLPILSVTWAMIQARRNPIAAFSSGLVVAAAVVVLIFSLAATAFISMVDGFAGYC